MFDTVVLKCPSCNEPMEFQSKGRDMPMLDRFVATGTGGTRVPLDVVSGLRRNQIYKCDCGVALLIKTKKRVRVRLVLVNGVTE